MSEGNIVDVK